MKRMLLLAALVLVLPALALSDSTNSFTRPVNLSQMGGAPGASSGMRLTLDQLGQPAVSYMVGGKIIIQRLTAGGWETLATEMTNVNPVLAYDQANNPNLVTYGVNPDYSGLKEVLYTRYNPANGWSPLLTVSPSSPLDSTGGLIAVDSLGRIHVVWSEPVRIDGTCPPRYDVYWNYFDGTYWSYPENVSHFFPGDRLLGGGPTQILADTQGGVHVLAVAATSNSQPNNCGPLSYNVFYLYFDGTSWSAPVSISQSSNYILSSSMALDSGGRPQVVYVRNGNYRGQSGKIFYTRLTGAGWTPPQSFSNIPSGGSSSPQIAIDTQDRPHILWVERLPVRVDADSISTNTTPNLLYLRGNGVGGFEGPEIITKGNCHTFASSPSTDLINDQVMIGPDNKLHLVYLSSDAFTSLYTSVYYSSLDLTLNLPMNEVWLPEVEAPLYTTFASAVVGERTSGCHANDGIPQVQDEWLVWMGNPDRRWNKYLGLYSLSLLDLSAEPRTIFNPEAGFLLSFDLAGATVAWAWTPNPVDTPEEPHAVIDPIEVIRLDDGTTIITGLISNHPLVADDFMAYYTPLEGAIYLHRFSDGSLSLVTDNCENIVGWIDRDNILTMFGLSDKYLIYRCYNAPYTAYRLADGSQQELYNAYEPILLSDSLVLAHNSANQMVLLYPDDGSTKMLLDNAVPLAFSGKYIVYQEGTDSTKLYLTELTPQHDLSGTRILYEDMSLTQLGVGGASISGDKVVIKDNNRCGYVLMDVESPQPPTNFTAEAIPGTRQIQLNWVVSASPDIKQYHLYMGGSPATIDYNSLYAGVDHPTNFYATGDLVNGQQYCFGLRGVDAFGNEYSGPGLVACATPRQWCENCGTIITPPVEWRLEVTLLEASAGLASDVYLDQPALELLITDSIHHEGQVVTSETTAVGGDPVRFFIQVHGETMGLGTYDHYSDSTYAWINQIDYYTYVIGFEDLPEDIADWDYNDVIIQVKFVPVDLGASPASACLSSAAIKTPRPGHQFCGNRGTVMAELTADKSLVQDVKFQARPVGAAEWFDLLAADDNHPNPDLTSPYFIHVDMSALADGDYELRAVTTDINACVDPALDTIVITVDQENCSSREGECEGGGHCKEVEVYSFAPEDILLAEPGEGDHIVSVSLPAGGLAKQTKLTLSLPSCDSMAQEGDEGFGECRMVNLANGQEWLLNDAQAQLMVSYADLDDDGIVDGTTVSAKNLRIYAQDPVTLVWSPLPGYVQSNKRMVVGNTNHFSSFQLGRKLPPKPIKLALSCALAPGPAALDGAGLASLALALLIPLMIGFGAKRRSGKKSRR